MVWSEQITHNQCDRSLSKQATCLCVCQCNQFQPARFIKYSPLGSVPQKLGTRKRNTLTVAIQHKQLVFQRLQWWLACRA